MGGSATDLWGRASDHGEETAKVCVRLLIELVVMGRGEEVKACVHQGIESRLLP